MREKLQDYLAKVHAEFDMTTILVSHDVAEIYKLASKVFVLDGSNVPLADTIEGFSMICRGEVDHIAEQAFFNVGGMEDVLANWDKMQKNL